MNARSFIRQLGPGLLFAGAAIGVSHLVQSTKAGALYGFDLLWVVIAIHLVKYPFFQFGPRYVAATGESLLAGYLKLGRWALWLFLLFSVGTIFTILAAVTVVTAGIASYLFGLTLAPWLVSGLILLLCAGLLLSRSFQSLERVMRVIILLLTISTLVAFVAALSQGYQPATPQSFTWTPAGIGFLLALMGWMPSPLDLSVWMSIWNEAKNKALPERQNLRSTLLDFNTGYWGTLIIAVVFLSLGALVMHGQGVALANSGAAFTGQLIQLYTQSIGPWIFWIIGLAALATMFSTTLTVLDAIPRVLQHTLRLLWPSLPGSPKHWRAGLTGVLITGALLLLGLWVDSMGTMVTIATILSFLTAPFFAIVNFVLITRSHIPSAFRPSLGLQLWSVVGVIFFLGFSGWYIYVTWWL